MYIHICSATFIYTSVQQHVYTHLFAISNQQPNIVIYRQIQLTHSKNVTWHNACYVPISYSTVPISYSKLWPRNRRIFDINRFCTAVLHVTVGEQKVRKLDIRWVCGFHRARGMLFVQ